MPCNAERFHPVRLRVRLRWHGRRRMRACRHEAHMPLRRNNVMRCVVCAMLLMIGCSCRQYCGSRAPVGP